MLVAGQSLNTWFFLPIPRFEELQDGTLHVSTPSGATPLNPFFGSLRLPALLWPPAFAVAAG